jgi:hypothetical protein
MQEVSDGIMCASNSVRDRSQNTERPHVCGRGRLSFSHVGKQRDLIRGSKGAGMKHDLLKSRKQSPTSLVILPRIGYQLVICPYILGSRPHGLVGNIDCASSGGKTGY